MILRLPARQMRTDEPQEPLELALADAELAEVGERADQVIDVAACLSRSRRG